MVDTILDHIFLIILTVAGLFTGGQPEAVIALGGLLMVMVTCESFQEKPGRALSAVQFLMMAFFAVLSGSFAGFLVFFLFRAVREWVRMLLALCLFFAAALLHRDAPFAMSVMQALLLAAVFACLMLARLLLEHLKKGRAQADERLLASNISRLHEKRLNDQLVMQNFLAQKNARLQERETISRNIHNSVGHSITAAIMTLDAADVLYDVRPEEARRRMNDANSRIRGSLESIRRAVRVLDEDCTDLSAYDLKCDLENVIREFVMDTDIRVDYDFARIADDVQILHDHAVFLTGALQEMLTNGVKHGGASQFALFMTGDSAHIRLEVSDNGRSDFDARNAGDRIADGFGIRKLVSYVEKCGGKASFVNEGGFRAMVELPLVYQDKGEHV